MSICEAPLIAGPNKGHSATGTEAGYQRHRKAGELACADCLAGAAAKVRIGPYAKSEKRRATSRAYQKANPESHREANRRWRQANPDYFHSWRENNPEYGSWRNMIQRCTNPDHIGYERWGGRGIMVCDRWLNSYDDFVADMGPKPSPEHSIDRIDNEGNYEPGNCRWATRVEQRANRRDAFVRAALDQKENHE